MNMKCMRCNCEKFYLDVDAQKVSCSSCGFYFDMKMLVPDNAIQKVQETPEPEDVSVLPDKLDSNRSDDFEIIGGVLTAYKGKDVDVVVPEGVLEIGVRTFMNMTQIRSVCLPESLKIIRREAFWGCTNLQRINIPDSVESIGESIITVCSTCDDGSDLVRHYSKSRCFWGCVNLTEIIWRENLGAIYCFEGTAYFENRKELMFEREKSIIKKGYCPKCGTKIVRILLNGCPNCGKSWVRWNGPIGWGVSANDLYNDLNLQGRYRR